MTDIVEIGPPEPTPERDIVYSVGPSQLRRVADLAATPAALALASLLIAVATLMVVDPASEIGDVNVFAHASSDANIVALRWAAGLRAVVALVALALAVVAARRLVGRRAQVRVGSTQPEADDASSLDALEAAAIARLAVPAPWQAMLAGSAMVVSLLALAFNAAAFGYAMASHVPPPQPVVPSF